MSIIKTNKISLEDTPITPKYLSETDWIRWIIPIPDGNKYTILKTSPDLYFRAEQIYEWNPNARYYDYYDQEAPIRIRIYARHIGKTNFEGQTLHNQKELIMFLDKVKDAVKKLQEET